MGCMHCERYELLTMDEVYALTKMGQSTVHEKIGRREFPKRLIIGPRIVRWRRRDVQEWVASRPLAGLCAFQAA